MSTLLEPPLTDRFDEPCPAGAFAGRRTPGGAPRQIVDAEGVIGADNGALRIQPLVEAGWGRAAVAYGPFQRQPGLAFAVALLNGHNTSQAENLPEELGDRVRRWLFGPESRTSLTTAARRLRAFLGSALVPALPRRLRWWMTLDPRTRAVPPLDENLAVGWFSDAAPGDPTRSGEAFVMHALGPENGELWARAGRTPLPAVRGVQNLPLLLVVVLRARGAIYYAASLPGARGLGGWPELRPVAVDPFDETSPLHAVVSQSVLGQIGFRVDTRVYGAHVAALGPEAAWPGTAHAAARWEDGPPTAGTAAEVGGAWTDAGPGELVLRPGVASGLVHLVVTATAGLTAPATLLFRYRDPENHWRLEADERGAALVMVRAGAREVVSAPEAATPPLPGLRPATAATLQILDDGRTLEAFLDGRRVTAGPVSEPWLSDARGVGLALPPSGNAPRPLLFEAHPSRVRLSDAVTLPFPGVPEGSRVVAADDFAGPPGPVDGRRTPVGHRRWTRLLGEGLLELTGDGQARVRGSVENPNPGRTAYTLPWAEPIADLAVTMTPPGTARGQKERGRCGFVFYQDPRNYVIVSVWVDDWYTGASVSSFYHLDGFEELFDAVWTNVGDRIAPGKTSRFRVTCDGGAFTAFVDGEPVLYRALTDVYPHARPLRIRRAGIAINWEWGDDTGTRLSRFEARA